MRTHLLIAALALVALLAPVAAPASSSSSVPDEGTFIVYLNDKPVSTEHFVYEVVADSVVMAAKITIPPPDSAGRDTFFKDVNLTMRASDLDPHDYQSVGKIAGHKVLRALTFGDTAFTAIRELNEMGEAAQMVRPPGKVFVIDPQVFSVFDLICRNMQGRTFTSREINLVVLGSRDAVKQGKVEDLGTEKLRWGERPVTARKLAISDDQARFVAWMSPVGRMLKLEAPEAGLRVEREAPPVKRRSKPGD
jgi:hypothetical protein